MIEFQDARIPMGRDRRLKIKNWTLKKGETWVIVGESGTGKSSLARVIADSIGDSGLQSSGISRNSGIRYLSSSKDRASLISFDKEKDIREEIRRNDDSEWSGKPDEGMSFEDFIGGKDGMAWLDTRMAAKLAGRGVRHLSTGEFRQVLIAREAGRSPAIAVLDEPFEGLDINARPRLTAQLEKWHRSGILIVLTVNRKEDIPSFATGLALLKNDFLVAAGPREEVIRHPDFPRSTDEPVDELQQDTTGRSGRRIPPPPVEPEDVGNTLLELKGLSLAFQGRLVLEKISWTVKKGESWLLTGPNGSGKTSLMNLISGDEPRGYGQDIRIFGRKKGSGESTSWIKARLGQVSAPLQENIPRHAGVAEVVGSGLRDALVLTDPMDGFELALVTEWLEVLGLKGKEEIPFFRLPYGERRLAMIGRAMVKHPPLLLLDEPMHGLDEDSRLKIAKLIDNLIRDTGTSVLFISHRPDDAPLSIDRHLRLIPETGGGPSHAEKTNRKT